ncbi:MAG: leucine-rich repeat protein [Candidatus Methanomethylophilaceae archaeon]|nr:leucine-rich repeat protein [Candidatus Methanomethylophilaceae archaeon]
MKITKALVMIGIVTVIAIVVVSYDDESHGAVGDSFTVADLEYSIVMEVPAAVKVTGTTTANLNSIDIPDFVKFGNKNYSVIEIERNAFSNMSYAKSITIPIHVTSIGYGAFDGCTGVETLYFNAISCSDFEINTGFKNIGKKNTLSIIFGNDVKNVPASFFENNYNIAKIVIGSNIETIGSRAFAESYNLKELDISNAKSLRIIGNYAFGKSQIESLALDRTPVESIGSSAFYECNSLTRIIVPSSVKEIGDRAFYNCTKVTDVFYDSTMGDTGEYLHIFSNVGRYAESTNVTFGPHVSEIQTGLFSVAKGFGNSESNKVSSVLFSDSISKIGNGAFSRCSNISSIDLPDSLHTIGAHSFEGCTSLNEITIPENVVQIGEKAFNSCSNVSVIYINAKRIANLEYSSQVFSEGKKERTVVFGNSVEVIPSNLFNGTDHKVTSVTVPDSVNHIGEKAFKSAYSIRNVAIFGCPTFGNESFSMSYKYYSTVYSSHCTVYSIMEDGFLSSFIDENTKINYVVLPHVELLLSDVRLNEVPDGWSLHNGNLMKYYEHGESITIPELSSTKMMVEGWTPSPESVMGGSTQYYTANWVSEISKVHTVTFDARGGSPCPSVEVSEGDVIPLPSTVRDGYVFKGWSIDRNTRMGDKDIVVYANWEMKVVTITVEFMDGTSLVSIAHGKVGDVLDAPKVSKAGYSFVSWEGYTGYFPSKDAVYTANWTKSDPMSEYYDVYYYSDYHTPLFLQSFKAGDPISELKIPEKKGYVFSGWKESISTMPEDNLCLTPIWLPEKSDDQSWLMIAGLVAGIAAIVVAAVIIRRHH